MGIRSICAGLVVLFAGACEKRDGGGENASPAKVEARDAGAAAAAADAAPPAPRAVEAAPRDELAVVVAPPKPGTSSIVTFDAKLDVDMNFGGLAMNTSSVQSKKKKVEIEAVAPDGTVRKRITYLKRDTNTVVDGQRKKDETPIRGKAYRVTWKNGAIEEVRRADGTPATEAETLAVRKEETVLQAPELLGRALTGLRLVEGQPFDVPASSLEALLQKEYRPKRLVLTYRGKTADGARIDAEGTLLQEDPRGLKMFLELKGEILLDPTGWCLEAKVTGQVRAELNGSVVGSGAGTGLVKATPLR